MLVRIRYLQFLSDLDAAVKEADAAGDTEGWPALRRLGFDYFQDRLGKMSGAELLQHLSSVGSWQTRGEWTVFKTIDEPSLAFTPQRTPNGEVILNFLGICYRYPKGSTQEWWNKIILPRLEKL
jgi:hypothetical protein